MSFILSTKSYKIEGDVSSTDISFDEVINFKDCVGESILKCLRKIGDNSVELILESKGFCEEVELPNTKVTRWDFNVKASSDYTQFECRFRCCLVKHSNKETTTILKTLSNVLMSQKSIVHNEDNCLVRLKDGDVTEEEILKAIIKLNSRYLTKPIMKTLGDGDLEVTNLKKITIMTKTDNITNEQSSKEENTSTLKNVEKNNTYNCNHLADSEFKIKKQKLLNEKDSKPRVVKKLEQFNQFDELENCEWNVSFKMDLFLKVQMRVSRKETIKKGVG
jgi:hypothetical protein